jgi:hypothetical protein
MTRLDPKGFCRAVESTLTRVYSTGVFATPLGLGQLQRGHTPQGYIRSIPYRACLISNSRDESQQIPVYRTHISITSDHVGSYQGQWQQETGHVALHLFTASLDEPSSAIFYLTQAIYRALVGADFSSEGLDRAALAIHGTS